MSAEITEGLGDYLPIIIALMAVVAGIFGAFNYVAKKTKDATAFRITTEHNYEKLDTKIDVQKEETDNRLSNIEDHLEANKIEAQNSTKEIINAITNLGETLSKK